MRTSTQQDHWSDGGLSPPPGSPIRPQSKKLRSSNPISGSEQSFLSAIRDYFKDFAPIIVPKNQQQLQIVRHVVHLPDRPPLVITRLVNKNLAASENKPFATLFYIDGTGFVAYNARVAEGVAGRLAELRNYQVCVIPHRLAPEHQVFDATRDVITLITHALNHATQFAIDTNNFSLAGYCSGATLAINAAIHLQRRLPKWPLRHLYLLSPFVDFANAAQHAQQFEKQDKIISSHYMEFISHLSTPPILDARHPLLSPLYQAEELTNLPSTTVFFGEFDRLRSQVETFVQNCINHSVTVSAYRLAGQSHAFPWRNDVFIEWLSLLIAQQFPGPPRQMDFYSLRQRAGVEPAARTNIYGLFASQQPQPMRTIPNQQDDRLLALLQEIYPRLKWHLDFSSSSANHRNTPDALSTEASYWRNTKRNYSRLIKAISRRFPQLSNEDLAQNITVKSTSQIGSITENLNKLDESNLLYCVTVNRGLERLLYESAQLNVTQKQKVVP